MSTFELSWEEFLEFNQDSLAKPSIASFIATVFIAIAVGVFGVVLTYAVEPGSKAAASSFCWLSLLLLIAAIWDLRFRTAKRRSRGVEELRAAYQQYYLGGRDFAFDQQKWVLQTQSGKQEVLWTGLQTAVERPSVITLSAKDHLVVVLPKRILSAADLDTLRRMAIRPTEKTWSSSVTLLDFLFTEIPSLWKRHPFLMAEAHLAGLFFFVMIANDMFHATGPGTYAGWIVAGLFLFLTLTTQLWYFLIKYLTSHRDLRPAWEVGFSQKGVHIRTSKVEFFSAWDNFRKAHESMRCFLLYIDSSQYYILPKSCMSAEQKDMARELLRAKLATRNRK